MHRGWKALLLLCLVLVFSRAEAKNRADDRKRSFNSFIRSPTRPPLRTAGWPDSYKIANSLDANAAQQTYRGEPATIYSAPILLKYAEVYYKFQEPIPLPKDVIAKYAGKQMAITGYEINVVRFDADGNEQSVPSYDAYNHHYVFFMKGSNWTEACVGIWCPPGEGLPHTDAPSMKEMMQFGHSQGLGDTQLDIQMLSEGNGNEHRGSFHGAPQGFAQIINSPDRLHPFIHLINTRGGGGRGGVGSTLLPRSSNAKPDARYSGLVECPCTTRRKFDFEKKQIDGKPIDIGFDKPLGCYGELEQQKNPSCSLETYKGGLRCCGHQMILLDEDQKIPLGVDQFFMKIRIWHEEAKPETKDLFRAFWMTEDRNNEYDIPHCKFDSDKLCVHTLINHFTAGEMCGFWGCKIPDEGFGLVYAGPHVHVGGLSMELINQDTGEQLCYSEAEYGTGEEALNEEGYIYSIPPCLWSTEDPALPDPPRIFNNTRLTTIARYSTNPGRYGAMALWQMRGAYIF